MIRLSPEERPCGYRQSESMFGSTMRWLNLELVFMSNEIDSRGCEVCLIIIALHLGHFSFTKIRYFIEYNVHTSIVRTCISQWFLAKKIFFKNNFTRISHCKFIHHKSHLKPFLTYLPCIMRRKYFSIIFNVKKCVLHSIKCGKLYF